MIFFTSCGYQPLYQNLSAKIEFNTLQTSGDQAINDKIINTININENKSDISLNNIFIDSTFNNIKTSKDLKGKAETYRSVLKVKVSIIKNDKVLKEQNFIETFNYANKESKFELNEYQKEIKQVMENNIIRKIRYFLINNDR